MRKQEWPKIRKRNTRVKGNPYTYYVVDLGVVDGKRITKNFKPDDTGEFPKNGRIWVEKKRRERNKIGKDALLLSDKDKKDAVRALDILMGRSSLSSAAEFFVAHNELQCRNRTTKQVINEYLQEAEQDNLRPASIQDLRTRLGRLGDAFSNIPISHITKTDAMQWLKGSHTVRRDGKAISPLSRKHYATVAGGLFNFAIEQGYTSLNPFANSSKRRKRNGGLQDEKLPEILKATEVRDILAAAETGIPEITPALAIGFFAGLRTSELRQLEWKYVDIDARIITVSPHIAKKRHVRHIDIHDNLQAWLSMCRKESGLVAPEDSAWRSKLAKVKKASGIDKWPHNAMRHSFATFHLAQFQDQNKTALQLGHRDTDLLYRHYRNLATAKEAETYWSILPKKT